MPCSRYTVLLSFLAIVAGVHDAAAQRASETLATVKTVDCTYTVMTTGTWVDGAPKFTTTPASLKVSFFNIDTQESTAEIKAAAGSSYFIAVRLLGEYLHLMQINSEGPIYTTTVFAREITRGSGRYLSVHTRHEYTEFQLPGVTSRPEQYIGDCILR